MHKSKECTHVLWTTGNSLFSRPRGERTASRRNVRRLPEINLTSGRRRRRKKSTLLKVPSKKNGKDLVNGWKCPRVCHEII